MNCPLTISRLDTCDSVGPKPANGRVSSNLENLENLEMSENFDSRRESRKSQGILLFERPFLTLKRSIF